MSLNPLAGPNDPGWLTLRTVQMWARDITRAVRPWLGQTVIRREGSLVPDPRNSPVFVPLKGKRFSLRPPVVAPLDASLRIVKEISKGLPLNLFSL